MRLCWKDYPTIAVPREIYWYYMAEIGIYVRKNRRTRPRVSFLNRSSVFFTWTSFAPDLHITKQHQNKTKQVHESIYLGIEVRRKDFLEYVIHHIATLSLLGGSWCYNFTPIGALVAVTHDAADSLLELAKLFNYVSNVRPWAQTVRLH